VGAPDPWLLPALAAIDYFYARMFRDWPGAITRTVDGYTLSYSGDTQLTGANHLWPRAPDAITALALREATVFFAPLRAAWSVIVTDTYMPQAMNWLAEYDYYPRWHSPLMVLDGPPQPVRANPTARVVPVTTREQLEDYAWVMSEVFMTGVGVNRRIARPDHLDDPAITHYLIYEGNEPVCCATATISNGVGGVWNVGTRRRFQRRGYATTIMLALLADLRGRGVTASALMASPSGQPIYERLGYRQIGITAYLRPPQFGEVVED
jgi:GNAT superfamily N-acetyltransferase